jgi:hypothetical protein
VAAFEHEFKSYEEDPGRRNVRDVDLVLEAIEAYGRQIDELDQGMTAELTVRGDVRGMMDGTVLSTNLP